MRNVVSLSAVRGFSGFVILTVLLCSFAAGATQSVVLEWYPVAASDVVGYTVHYGTASRQYSHAFFVPGASASISGLVEGQSYFFAVSARARGGLESALSEELAYFVPPAPNGNYSGLFYEPTGARQDSTGSFSVSVKRGAYSGKLQMGSTRYSFSGKIGSSYQASNLISRRSAGPLTVHFAISGGSGEKISGNVSDGAWMSSLAGDSAVFNSKTHPAPYAGQYTMIIGGRTTAGLPGGEGIGTVKVSASGLASFAGVLADGTKVSQGAMLSGQGYWPMYAALYSSKGMVASWLHFTNASSIDLSGAITWLKPADPAAPAYPGGFVQVFNAIGQVYVPSPVSMSLAIAFARGAMIFTGGALGAGFSERLIVASTGKVTSPDDPQFTLSFSGSLGTFKGRMTEPATGQPISFQGVVLQKANVGDGFLLASNQSSRVILTP